MRTVVFPMLTIAGVSLALIYLSARQLGGGYVSWRTRRHPNPPGTRGRSLPRPPAGAAPTPANELCPQHSRVNSSAPATPPLKTVGDYCPCGAHVIGTPCRNGYPSMPYSWGADENLMLDIWRAEDTRSES